MIKKHPDQDYFTQQEWERFQEALVKLDPILKDFARRSFFHYEDYFSQCVERRLWVRSKSNTDKYYLDKILSISLVDKVNLRYEVSVAVLNAYGPMNLFAFVPFLRENWKSWKRYSWGKTLGEFQGEIDPLRLTQLLEQGKQILNNFDESQLQEVKSP